MWNNLLAQTDLTLNPLLQDTLNPRISAWEYFNFALYYAATPLGPIGCKIIIHTTSNNRKSLDRRGREGFSVRPSLHHYRCIQVIYSKIKALSITDTEEYLHEYMTQPIVTSEDIMTHAKHLLYAVLKDVPTTVYNYQLAAMEDVRAILSNWRTFEASPTVPPTAVPNPPKPIIPLPKPSLLRYPSPTSKSDHGKYRVTTSKGAFKKQTPVIPKGIQLSVKCKGDQEPIAARTRSLVAPPPNFPPFKAQIQTLDEPVAARTRSCTVSHNFTTPSRSRSFLAQMMTHAA